MVVSFPYPQSYFVNHPNGWSQNPVLNSVVGPLVVASPAPYVDHRAAKKIRNDVNVNRESLRLEVDEHFPDQRLVSFAFDALHDGRFGL